MHKLSQNSNLTLNLLELETKGEKKTSKEKN